MAIQFTAYGVPAPKGSTKAFFRPGMRFPVVTEDNARTRPWAAIVKDAAIQAGGGPGKPINFPKGIPVVLTVCFHMPRPASLPKKVIHPTKKPDLDKLVRAIKDALTGVVWVDDSQVITIHASKSYVWTAIGERPCAEIAIESLDSNPTERAAALPSKCITGQYITPEERTLF